MTIRSGFHTSINGDRKYNGDEMNRPYKDIVSNGVFPNPSDQLQVFASSNLTVSVIAGGGLFGSGWVYNNAPVLLTLDPAESSLNRIDAIVLTRDDSESVRNSFLTIKKGTPATDPVRPEMVRSELINEYCLATIYVTPETSEITQSMITDTRPDTTVCGWVTGLIEQVDTSTLFTQWQSAYKEQYNNFMHEFNVWWAGVRNILIDDETASAQILLLTAEKADKKKNTITLPSSGWALTDGYYYQTMNVPGMAGNDIVIVAGDPSTLDAYNSAGIVAIEQDEGTIKFRATVATTAKINIVNMGA